MPRSVIASASGVMKLLQSVLSEEIPLVGTLATIDVESLPSARMMVIRGIDGSSLWMSTHAASEKVGHLRNHPVAELVVWLQEKRIQLRLRATWRVIDGATAGRNQAWAIRREQVWQEQPDEARRLFFGPAPGERITGRAKQLPPASVTGEPPAVFAVLLGIVERIDALWIKKPVHERYVHERVRQEWRTTRVTP